MAALTAVRNTQSKSLPEFKFYPIKDNVKIYKGALVCVDSTGFAVTGATTAGNRVVGVADDTYDNTVTGHAAGALNVKVVSGRVFRFNGSGLAQSSVGQPAYLIDDNTVGLAPQTNDIYVGLIVEFISSTDCWVMIGFPDNEGLAVTTVGSVAGGYRVVRGQSTTVAASDTIVTGLSTLIGVVATLNDDPGLDPGLVSASIGDQAGTPAAGSFLLKTWKFTSNANPTPLAATTFSKKVNWVAIGL